MTFTLVRVYFVQTVATPITKHPINVLKSITQILRQLFHSTSSHSKAFNSASPVRMLQGNERSESHRNEPLPSRILVRRNSLEQISMTSYVHLFADLYKIQKNKNKIHTRMHSSRMRTGRSLTVCWRLLPGGGLPGSGGVCLVWGGSLVLEGSAWSGGGLWSWGVCLVQGGVCLVRGVGLWSQGGVCLVWGGWHPSMH